MISGNSSNARFARVCLSTDELTYSSGDCQKMRHNPQYDARQWTSIRGLSLQAVLRARQISLAAMVAVTLQGASWSARADVESGVTAYESGEFRGCGR